MLNTLVCSGAHLDHLARNANAAGPGRPSSCAAPLTPRIHGATTATPACHRGSASGMNISILTVDDEIDVDGLFADLFR
jgi:hypothetical protein